MIDQQREGGVKEQPKERTKYTAYFTQDTMRGILLEKSRHPGRECIVQIPGIRIGNDFFFDMAADSGIHATYRYAMCEKDHRYADHLSTRIVEYYDILWELVTVSQIHSHPPKIGRFSDGDFASNISLARKYGGVINGIILVDPEFRLLLWYIDTDGKQYEAQYIIDDEKVRSAMPRKDLTKLKEHVEELEKKAAAERMNYGTGMSTLQTPAVNNEEMIDEKTNCRDGHRPSLRKIAAALISKIFGLIRRKKKENPDCGSEADKKTIPGRTALEILSQDSDVYEEVKALSLIGNIRLKKVDHQTVALTVAGAEPETVSLVWKDGQMHIVKSRYAQVYKKGCLKQYLFPEDPAKDTEEAEADGETDGEKYMKETIREEEHAVFAVDDNMPENDGELYKTDGETCEIDGVIYEADDEIFDIDEKLEAFRPFTVLLPETMKTDFAAGELRGYYIPSTKTFNVLTQEAAEKLPDTVVLGKAFAENPVGADKDISAGMLLVYQAEGELDARVQGNDAYADIRFYNMHADIFSRNKGVLDVNAIGRKQAVIIGCGSGGGFIAPECAKAGIGSIVVIDADKVEYHNICRHVCGVPDVGKFKTDAIEERILGYNPDCIVCKFTEELEEIDPAELEAVLWKDAVIICCTDNRHAAYACSRLADQYHIPMVAAGCGPRASTGEIYYYKPDVDMPCYTCAFGEDKGVDYTNQAVRRVYYATEAELEKMDFQPGMALDIEITAIFAAKLAIDLLMENEPGYECKVLPYIGQCTIMLNYPVSEDINPFMKMFKDGPGRRPFSYKRCSVNKNPDCTYCSSAGNT